MAKVYLIVKYGFFAVMVFGAGIVIERVAGIRRWWKNESFVGDDLNYNNSSPMVSQDLNKTLSKRYLRCLTDPSKPFCLLSSNKRIEVFRSKDTEPPSVEEIESRLQNITSDFHPRRRRIHSLLIAFTKFMKIYQIKTVMMEPSILFCLLSSSAKFNMLSKGFNPGRLLGSRNVVSVGILDEDSKKLNEKNVTSEMVSAGFKIIKFQKWIHEDSAKKFETLHYFFILEDVAVHAIVFYKRSNYWWHAGLDPKEIDFGGLLFFNEEIYENFALLPLNVAGTSISRLFIPSDVRYFMAEIESSKVAQCRTNASGVITSVKHPNLTNEQLNVRATVALTELKTLFAEYGALFWLWSKTLLGWFTECDVFHFTPTIDLALKYSSIKDLNISERLAGNEFLQIQNNTELGDKFGYKLECYGLLVNLHFIHEEDNGLAWKSRGDGEEERIFKCSEFKLCSSTVFGLKVHVPCNTSVVLETEYIRNGTDAESINYFAKS